MIVYPFLLNFKGRFNIKRWLIRCIERLEIIGSMQMEIRCLGLEYCKYAQSQSFIDSFVESQTRLSWFGYTLSIKTYDLNQWMWVIWTSTPLHQNQGFVLLLEVLLEAQATNLYYCVLLKLTILNGRKWWHWLTETKPLQIRCSPRCKYIMRTQDSVAYFYMLVLLGSSIWVWYKES